MSETAKERHLYKVGRLLLMQRGEYSDQSTVGLFRVLQDFNAKEAVRRYFDLYPDQAEDRHVWDDGAAFVKMLIDAGYLEELDYDVLHTGCYGRLEID